MQVCPRCGEENSDRASFCQTCGGPLAVEAAPVHEIRKTVTVLFSDVAGSTALGERLDPESLRRVMKRSFDVIRQAIERHGGTVEKFIGDAVMAVFGIPTLHEDDALRACRAAMEIQVEIDRLNNELERDWGVTIALRTGLNTGEVIAGDPSSGQTLVTGDAVNTAARLEQAAPAGAVLIGEPTYRLVRDAADAEMVEPIAAKGKAEPVAAYRLLSVAPGPPTRPRRLDSAMVGREEELRALEGALDRSTTERACVLVTIVGMPGVGKSRLVYELIAGLADRAAVLRGRCLPYGDGITFWPIAEVVRQAAGISEGDSTEEARSRIETLLPESEDRATIRDRIAAAVGLGETTGSIHETFWAIRKLFESLADDRPLIVAFDDIHWAEPTLLDLIEYVEGWSEGSGILLLCVARPELLEARPAWASGATRAVTIDLDPLTAEKSDRLIQNLLGPDAVSVAFRQRIAEAAEGNPLFVEEMLGMLIDAEQLSRGGDGWVAAGELSSIPTPPSIQSLVAARIERLPDEEREVLQHASVVGKVFWWDAVADLTPANARTQVGSHLQTLVRKGMIRPEETSVAGQDAFRFHHILIRDAAYQSLPKRTRARLHERFARWMEHTVGERIEEHEEILGYHFEQACRQQLASRPGSDLARRASRLLASAGRRALAREDVNAAINLLSRASELAPSKDRDNLSTRFRLAEALRLAGELQRADVLLSELVEQAASAGDRSLEWRAKIQRTQIVATTSNAPFDTLAADIAPAIEIFTELGDEWGLSKSLVLLAFLQVNAGRAGEAQGTIAKAALHARSAGAAGDELWSVYGGAIATGPTPVEEALVLFDDLLDRVRGHPALEAAVLVKRAPLPAMRGDFETARADIQRAREIRRELGLAHALARMTDSAGTVEWYAGDPVGAEREWRAGYDALRARGVSGYQATWAAALAELMVELGREDEALALSRESEDLAAEDDPSAQVPWRGARAKVLARRGDRAESERLAREAVTIAKSTDWPNQHGDALMDLAEVLRLTERPSEAADAAREALDRYEQKGNVVMAARVRTFLEELAASSQP